MVKPQQKSPSERTLKRIAKVRAAMYDMIVNTPSGRKRLTDLCDNIGVKNRVAYWNYMERKRPGLAEVAILEVVHDRGLIFNDGFQIRHVDVAVYNYFKAIPVIKIRERKV